MKQTVKITGIIDHEPACEIIETLIRGGFDITANNNEVETNMIPVVRGTEPIQTGWNIEAEKCDDK